jgi:hypothetical protein
LAAITPKLKEAALRLATHLAAAEHQPHHTITASTRELSEKTGLVPSSLTRVINELCDPKRALVTARRDSGNRTTMYQVNFLETVRGAFFGEARPEVNKVFASTEAARSTQPYNSARFWPLNSIFDRFAARGGTVEICSSVSHSAFCMRICIRPPNAPPLHIFTIILYWNQVLFQDHLLLDNSDPGPRR